MPTPPNPPNVPPNEPPDPDDQAAPQPDGDPSYDLSRMLAGWPYEPGKLSARIVPGDDGEPRLQIRLDLGLLQMHLEGRPDGQRPRGFDSLLEYHEARLDEFVSRNGPPGGGAPGEGGAQEFTLSADECRELREEAVQYYQRYTGLLVMEDYDGVVRDTTRNLRLLDFCKQYAESEGDRTALEQFRAYITMTRARALASQALKDDEPKAALHAVEEGLEALRQHFSEHGPDGAYEQSGEVQMLSQMRDALIPRQPLTPRQDLKRRLAEAVSKENYELAALLRDELKNMPE
ncbi:MAG: UvrB/UvrC motif-containing protein [Phycisphaerales bacterium]|nr:UvrB/UvrC motif-containing protein [Phycisphaerales bacterium]